MEKARQRNSLPVVLWKIVRAESPLTADRQADRHDMGRVSWVDPLAMAAVQRSGNLDDAGVLRPRRSPRIEHGQIAANAKSVPLSGSTGHVPGDPFPICRST